MINFINFQQNQKLDCPNRVWSQEVEINAILVYTEIKSVLTVYTKTLKFLLYFPGGLALSAVYPPLVNAVYPPLVNIPVQAVHVVTQVEMAQPMPYYQQMVGSYIASYSLFILILVCMNSNFKVMYIQDGTQLIVFL